MSHQSVDYSLNNPQDPFVTKRLDTKDHNEIMSKIDKKLAPYYDQLAQEFCIAKNDRTTIRANALTKVNSQWEGLNEVVDAWLRGNNEAYVKGVRPNVRWLVEAVGKIDPVHGTKLATEYGIPELSDNTHNDNTHNDKDKTEDHTTVKTSDKGLEETDSGIPAKKAKQTDESEVPVPPNCSDMCQPIDDEDFEKIPCTEDIVKDVDIILVTATKKEYRAVVRSAQPTGRDGKKYVKVTTEDGSKFMLGLYGKNTVAIIRTGQGPKETRKMLEKVQPIIKAKYVIAIGICYGMNNAKSKLGDIIVAESVWDISQSRETDDESKFKPKEYPTGAKLQNIFTDHDNFKVLPHLPDVKPVEIHYGALVTEDTLVASEKRKKDILKQIPQAVGGEMEAEGIAAAATSGKYEWIVIKAIADWGDAHKEPYRKWQEYASIAAARFVLKCLEDKLK